MWSGIEPLEWMLRSSLATAWRSRTAGTAEEEVYTRPALTLSEIVKESPALLH